MKNNKDVGFNKKTAFLGWSAGSLLVGVVFAHGLVFAFDLRVGDSFYICCSMVLYAAVGGAVLGQRRMLAHFFQKECHQLLPEEKKRSVTHFPIDIERLQVDGLKALGVYINRINENYEKKYRVLKDLQIRFFGLFDESPLSMQLFSPDGYIRRVNKTFEHYFGISEFELITANFNIIKDREYVGVKMRELIRYGFHEAYIELPEVWYRRSTDYRRAYADAFAENAHSDVWLRGYIYPIKDEAGEIIEVVVTHEDVTQRKHAEANLKTLNAELEKRVEDRTAKLQFANDELKRSKDRAEAATRAKSRFLANMSHELRTPLTAIKEATSMLLEGIFKEAPEKQAELLLIAKNECERLIASVNTILDFSSMEANMIKYYFRKCSVIPIIQKCLLKLAPIAQQKGVDLELVPPSYLPEVTVDEERIGQVVENLVGNALKFTQENDEIVIRTQLVKEDLTYIEIGVKDTGRGLPECDLELIFEKFNRGTHQNDEIVGTGLGLYITKNIIEAHGGDIRARNNSDKGSEFLFRLPVVQG